MDQTRRGFFGILAGLPLVGKFIGKPQTPKPTPGESLLILMRLMVRADKGAPGKLFVVGEEVYTQLLGMLPNNNDVYGFVRLELDGKMIVQSFLVRPWEIKLVGNWGELGGPDVSKIQFFVGADTIRPYHYVIGTYPETKLCSCGNQMSYRISVKVPDNMWYKHLPEEEYKARKKIEDMFLDQWRDIVSSRSLCHVCRTEP